MKVRVEIKEKYTEHLKMPYYEVSVLVWTGWRWKRFKGPLDLTRYLLKRNHSKEIRSLSLIYRANVMSKLSKEIKDDIILTFRSKNWFYEGNWVLFTRKKDGVGEENLTRDIEEMSEDELTLYVEKWIRLFIACILANIPVVFKEEDMNNYDGGYIKHLECD